MQENQYGTLPVAQLRKIARERGVKIAAGSRKSDIVALLCAQKNMPEASEEEKSPKPEREENPNGSALPNDGEENLFRNRNAPERPTEAVRGEFQKSPPAAGFHESAPQLFGAGPIRTLTRPKAEESPAPQPWRRPGYRTPSMPIGREKREGFFSMEKSPQRIRTGDAAEGGGILEIHPEGYGFLRTGNYACGRQDVYVSVAQIRKFALRPGDLVRGKVRRGREEERYGALAFLESVNGLKPEEAMKRKRFESLTPVYPSRRYTLENQENKSDLAIRLIDCIAPIGFGQRALIVSPPKAGKTVLLKKIAGALAANYPQTHLMVLLIDERPEEVTDLKRCVRGEVAWSTFDEMPENHVRVAELVFERAQRLVEHGEDVVILLDSITRLSRACNALSSQTGRALSGGLAPDAMQRPKRLFGSARNLEEGGSLTVIATALVETGSRMDEVIFEEFKGTGNMEIHLDRRLSERRIFPAIDLSRSGTRHEEMLLSEEEVEGLRTVRRVLLSAGNQEATEQFISMMERSPGNREFFKRLKEWTGRWEKEGFVPGGRRNPERTI